jgi:hypothetical protein
MKSETLEPGVMQLDPNARKLEVYHRRWSQGSGYFNRSRAASKT